MLPTNFDERLSVEETKWLVMELGGMCFVKSVLLGLVKLKVVAIPLIKKVATTNGQVVAWRLCSAFTFIQMVQSLLKMNHDRVEQLSTFLVDRNHSFTSLEIEALIKHQEKEEGVDLLVKGPSNFFFVLEDGTVSVARVYWSGGRWRTRRYSLSVARCWPRGCRFFSRS